MKIARIIAVCLLAVMLLSMFAACNDDGDAATTTKPTVTTNDDSKDANGYVKDNLDPSLNYNGTTFNIRCWEQNVNEYDFESLSDDADDVDEALYNRNRKVEERLGVELKYLPIPGNSNDTIDNFVNDVSTSIKANLGTYDAVGAYTRCAGVLGSQGMYADLMTVDNIDTDMPWWPEEIISTNTVADKLYFATGDIATSLIYRMYFMIINKEYAEELGNNVEEIQQLALDGGWDLTTMFNITANGWKENDSTSGKSSGDKFGLAIGGHPLLDAFYMGAGLTYVTSDEEGLRISEDYASPLSQSILQKFANALNSNSYYYGGSAVDMTLGNSMLYVVEGYSLAKTLRNATYTYHILPAPKYSAEQTDYYTAVGFQHSMYSIPKDAKDISMSGAVLECMASESYRQVTPVLFDKVFLYKLTNATIDISILTLVRDRTTFDLGRTFFEELGADQSSPIRLWRNLLTTQSTRVEGLVNVYGETWNNTLKDLYKKFSN